MAASDLDFSAQIDAWVAKTTDRAQAVFRESTQRVISKAQENVPVDTGFLRASLRASTESMPPIDDQARPSGAGYSYDGGQITLTIAGAELGSTIFAGYTASYAIHVEMGTSRMAPRGFVALAAAQWPSIVSQVTQELKARAGQ